MALGTRLRPAAIAALSLAMGGGVLQAAREWRELWAERHVALSVSEVVRLRGGRAVVVLDDRSHARRLPVPVTLQEGAAIEHRRSAMTSSLLARSIDALGGHVVRVAIGVDASGGLSATLVLGRGLFGSHELPLETADGIRIALEEGAPIETSLDLIEAAGISDQEARTLALDAARGRVAEASSLPVHTF